MCRERKLCLYVCVRAHQLTNSHMQTAHSATTHLHTHATLTHHTPLFRAALESFNAGWCVRAVSVGAGDEEAPQQGAKETSPAKKPAPARKSAAAPKSTATKIKAKADNKMSYVPEAVLNKQLMNDTMLYEIKW